MVTTTHEGQAQAHVLRQMNLTIAVLNGWIGYVIA
jgi:hypothetical protein